VYYLNNNFKSSADVFEWISGFINLERGQKPKSFDLNRMKVLTELAGHPEKCAPSIHIAGSKGKGSVTGMITAILTAAGYRAARYMSPHVTDIRERICLGDEFFDEEIYCSAGNELRHTIDELLPIAEKSQQTADLFNESEPTFWELLTLFFFLCARKSQCDVMIVETGMGGRLDSTNVLDPLVSVITLIELEHTNILGKTIAAIAGEKAGIIKTGKPLILAKQSDEALEVFKNTAKENNSPLIYFPQIAQLSDIKITAQGTEFSLLLNLYSSIPLCAFVPLCEIPLNKFSIPLPGKVQAENAALAVAAIKISFPQINEEAIRKGLAELKIPARFEKIADQPPFIIDGAHTPESLTLCIETFCSLYGVGGILLFGCAADKDARVMAKIAHLYFSKIIITTPGTFKKSNPEKVYGSFAEIAGKDKTELVVDTQEAIKKVRYYSQNISHRGTEAQRTRNSNKEEKDVFLPILGTGSFYLVSEIRKFIYN